jgi:hypothetical protein
MLNGRQSKVVDELSALGVSDLMMRSVHPASTFGPGDPSGRVWSTGMARSGVLAGGPSGDTSAASGSDPVRPASGSSAVGLPSLPPPGQPLASKAPITNGIHRAVPILVTFISHLRLEYANHATPTASPAKNLVLGP